MVCQQGKGDGNAAAGAGLCLDWQSRSRGGRASGVIAAAQNRQDVGSLQEEIQKSCFWIRQAQIFSLSS